MALRTRRAPRGRGVGKPNGCGPAQRGIAPEQHHRISAKRPTRPPSLREEPPPLRSPQRHRCGRRRFSKPTAGSSPRGPGNRSDTVGWMTSWGPGSAGFQRSSPPTTAEQGPPLRSLGSRPVRPPGLRIRIPRRQGWLGFNAPLAGKLRRKLAADRVSASRPATHPGSLRRSHRHRPP